MSEIIPIGPVEPAPQPVEPIEEPREGETLPVEPPPET